MGKTTIYKVKFYFPPPLSLLPFAWGFLCVIIEKQVEFQFAATPQFYRALFWSIMFALVGILIVFINFLIQFKFVVVAFYSKKYLKIEGMVSHLVQSETKRGQDTFDMEGTHFVIGRKWTAGLQKTKIGGGPEIKEGQYLYISYVSLQSNNIIVLIEEDGR